LIVTWLDTKEVMNVIGTIDPGNEIIWNNSCIKSSGNTLYFKEWIDAGFVRVSDLFDENNMFLTFNEINKKVRKTGKTMIQYYAVKSAVPRNWKKRIKKVAYSNKAFGLKYKGIFYSLDNLSSKIFRKLMISKLVIKPICETFWERKFRHDFNWNQIWTNVLSLKEPKLVALNWKILFNIYPTKVYLYKIGKEENNICNKCKVEDNTVYFFIKCNYINKVWDEVNGRISNIIGKKVNLSETDILFGYNDENKENNAHINQIVSVVKMCISKYRYGKHFNIVLLLQKELRLRHM